MNAKKKNPRPKRVLTRYLLVFGMAGLLVAAAALHWLVPILIVIAVACTATAAKRFRSPSIGSGNYGTAHFATFSDLQQAGYLGNEGSIIGRLPEYMQPGRAEAIIALFKAPLRDSERVVTQFFTATKGGK